MAVWIPKKLVLQIYCCSRQAERSVDAVLLADWSELRGYYNADRTQALHSLNARLDGLLACLPPRSSVPSREQIAALLPWENPFAILLGRWFAPWMKSWRVTHSELLFLASTMRAFVRTIGRPDRPNQEELIALRMDLHACEIIVERRCPGLRELAVAQRVEHFNQAPHITPVRMEELIQHQGADIGITHEHS